MFLILGGLKDGFVKPKLVAQLYHFYVNCKRVVSDENLAFFVIAHTVFLNLHSPQY